MKKIRVNTESLISALFLLGYEKVDAVLYMLVLGAIKTTDNKLKITDLELDFSIDDSLSNVLSNCIKPCTAVIIELKEGYDLNTDVSSFNYLKEGTITLYDYINNSNNNSLATYIDNYINMEEIIRKKMSILGDKGIPSNAKLYSEKEKEIINNQKKKIKHI